MAEGGFDPCECIWNHEMAMRRLLSLLRQSQSYCTDNECLDELPGPTANAQDAGSDSTFFTVMMMWTLVAMALFFMRPSSLRSDPNAKPANSNQDGGSPPSPPTAN